MISNKLVGIKMCQKLQGVVSTDKYEFLAFETEECPQTRFSNAHIEPVYLEARAKNYIQTRHDEYIF